MKIIKQRFPIMMPDGHYLSVNQFEPANPHALILVCSAAGVGQYYYFGIARYLATKGYTVITFDCRGIGESSFSEKKHKIEAGLNQLSQDFEHLTDWVSDNFPYLPMAILGHSLGGILPMFAKNNDKFSAIFTVGTQMAYHKDWGFSNIQRLNIYFHWHIILPVLTNIFGYFPGKTLKLGIENLPASLVRDIHNRRKYSNIFTFLKTIGLQSYHLQICCPVMAMTMADDAICTPKALNRFFDELSNATITKQIIHPEEVNADKIGHLHFFKRKFSDSLWLKVGAWFDAVLLEEKNLKSETYITHRNNES